MTRCSTSKPRSSLVSMKPLVKVSVCCSMPSSLSVRRGMLHDDGMWRALHTESRRRAMQGISASFKRPDPIARNQHSMKSVSQRKSFMMQDTEVRAFAKEKIAKHYTHKLFSLEFARLRNAKSLSVLERQDIYREKTSTSARSNAPKAASVNIRMIVPQGEALLETRSCLTKSTSKLNASACCWICATFAGSK